MFGTVEVRTRPLRLAHLIDPNSAAQAREAIRLSSSLWGGAYFPIIPLYKRMPATWRDKPLRAPAATVVIPGYLEAFDPDILIQFSREVPSFIAETGHRVIRPEEIWSALDEEQNLSPRFGIGIFEILNDVFERYFRYTVKYPKRVILPRIPRSLSLFWTSWLGELPAKVVAKLQENYFELLEIETPAFSAAMIGASMGHNVLLPRHLTQHGLQSRASRSSFARQASVFYLDATKVADIVDFWNLRALGGPVVPVPKQLRGDPQLKAIVVEFLKYHRRPWPHDPKVCDTARFIRARNCKSSEMQAYASSFKITPEPDDPSADPFFALQDWYPRVWDEWAREKDGAVPDDVYGDTVESIEVKELEFRFRALLPKFAFEHSFHGEPRCANEIGFRLYGTDQHLAEVFPRSPGRNLARAISGIGSFREWRVGRNGLVKFVEHGFTETRGIPTSESVFFAWLTDLGWNPQISAPGLLAKEIYKRLRGNSGILKNEPLLGLLERMNGGKAGQETAATDVKHERELSVGEVKKRLENSPEGCNPHDHLISLGVFRLGIRVQCPHCTRHSWFSLESLGDTLTCPKCLNSYSAIGNVDAPNWSYKTAGPFSVPRYAEGAYTVLLTLEFIAGHRLGMMRTTPVFSFSAVAPSKNNFEADIAMFWQEFKIGDTTDGLLFGECKTYGVFENRDFERMRYFAETFPGAILLFSTLRKDLGSKEIAAITRIAKAGRRYWKADRPINPVLILTGTELLHLSRPPYCWEPLHQQKLSRAYGLLDVCDATQQIHLGLPSWRVDWREKWENLRLKRRGNGTTS